MGFRRRSDLVTINDAIPVAALLLIGGVIAPARTGYGELAIEVCNECLEDGEVVSIEHVGVLAWRYRSAYQFVGSGLKLAHSVTVIAEEILDGRSDVDRNRTRCLGKRGRQIGEGAG